MCIPDLDLICLTLTDFSRVLHVRKVTIGILSEGGEESIVSLD